MIKKLICLFLITFLTACVTVDHVETSPMRTTMVTTGDLGFISEKTSRFAWHPSLENVVADERINSEKVVRHMRTSITQMMESKGYRLVSIDESPDLLIGFGLALESNMSDAEILKEAGLVAGLSTAGIDSDQYEKGSVLVALFKPMQLQPVWRVLAQGFTDFKQSGEQRQQRFDELISLMLGSIPSV
ncbi:DUF4136 domain-containing protein [Shewanella sp. YLB-07]|nr:DUF4136 domain-containing protein [Shewanella sp. YLB-07]MPY22127.1 DUF4136 domain-containing protein [Shewanella sp. YLB-07]